MIGKQIEQPLEALSSFLMIKGYKDVDIPSLARSSRGYLHWLHACTCSGFDPHSHCISIQLPARWNRDTNGRFLSTYRLWDALRGLLPDAEPIREKRAEWTHWAKSESEAVGASVYLIDGKGVRIWRDDYLAASGYTITSKSGMIRESLSFGEFENVPEEVMRIRIRDRSNRCVRAEAVARVLIKSNG